MITVLKYINKNEIECKNCKALLRYEYKDLKEEKYNFLRGQQYITCPQCNRQVFVEVS